jgi:hypothetical protein
MAGGFATSGFATEPFTFITNRRVAAEYDRFFADGLKKPFFQAISVRWLLWIDCCALFSETASFEHGV